VFISISVVVYENILGILDVVILMHSLH